MDKILNGVKSLTTIAKNKVSGVEQHVSPEKAQKRLNICKACPHLNKVLNNCKKCGCFVAYKTKYKQEACPEGYWKAEETE